MTLTTYLAAVKTALSNSTAFQTWVGAVTPTPPATTPTKATQALAHVVLFNVDIESCPDPVCVIYQGGDYERTREGMGNYWFSNGSIVLHFEEEVDLTDNIQERLVQIVTAAEGVMSDLEGAALFESWTIESDDPSVTPRSETRQAARCAVVAKITQGGNE